MVNEKSDAAKKDAGEAIDQMFTMWRDGAEAFMKANAQLAETVQRGFADATQNSRAEPGDAMETWQAFIKSWAPNWDPSAMVNGMKTDGIAPDLAAAFEKGLDGLNASFGASKEAFYTMMDPSVWSKHAPEQLRKIMETIASGPRFADLATPQLDTAASWREVTDYNAAMGDFAKVMQAAWMKTYQRFSENYSIEDLQSGDMNDALQNWLKLANEELLNTQRSPEFMDAQRRLLRAGTEIQARQRDIAESWSASFQMPTRTEVDDLSRMVHELRREVRTLKRELATQRSKQPGAK